MCCGRGIKAAATRTYVTPKKERGLSMAKHKPKTKVLDHLKGLNYPQRKGAYYGNPVKTKKAKLEKIKLKEAKTTNPEEGAKVNEA